VKRIDNSSVIRASDPVAQAARSKSMATGFAAAVLIIAGLMSPPPITSPLVSRSSNCGQDQVQLQRQRAILETQEAQLVNPDRCASLPSR
jgi:hypothetical protein